jgi:LPXTG-motif cell wall-anchored protein
MDLYLTIMTNFYILGVLLTIALALVVIARRKRRH